MIDNGASTLPTKLDRERVTNTEDPKGFSLIELLVVIVIIGIIAAIGTPQLLGMRTRSSVRADARDLHSAYRQAQTEAVKRSENACVVINDGAETYQIQIADYFGTKVPGKSTYLLEKSARPGNNIIAGGIAEACFNARGLPTSGEGTITLTNPSLTMIVTLTPSGHVKSTNL